MNDTSEQRRIYRCTEHISNKLHANGRPSKVAYNEKERKQKRGGEGGKETDRTNVTTHIEVSCDVCMHTRSGSTRYDAIECATRLRSSPEHPERVASPGPGETRNVLFLHSFPHLPCPPPPSSSHSPPESLLLSHPAAKSLWRTADSKQLVASSWNVRYVLQRPFSLFIRSSAVRVLHQGCCSSQRRIRRRVVQVESRSVHALVIGSVVMRSSHLLSDQISSSPASPSPLSAAVFVHLGCSICIVALDSAVIDLLPSGLI